MRLSIIIPVLDSHEIVRRQSLHFINCGIADLALNEEVEVIIVDDGSKPPLLQQLSNYPWLDIIATNDFRSWTQPKARNLGAKSATGEFLLFTDIDHIVTKEAVEFALNCKYDYARFRRELAVLDKQGVMTQDRDALAKYGVEKDRGLRISCHTLSMIVRASVFQATGGFAERLGRYPTHDDGNMKQKLKQLEETNSITKCPDKRPDERPVIYMIPNGRFVGNKDADPLGLFHKAQR